MAFKIFFSWQSDLAPNRTRWLIEEAIQKTKEMLEDVIDVEADRDTKGMTGTPDIAETIRNKIDESDLFVADVSFVATKGNKGIPNPNVMIELGYASAKLGWDRVICVLNTEFGGLDMMPFDLRGRRTTPYQITEQHNRNQCIDEIKDILVQSAYKLKGKPKLNNTKSIFSNFEIGSFSIENGTIAILKKLEPYEIGRSSGTKAVLKTFERKCGDLIKKVRDVKLERSEDDYSEHACLDKNNLRDYGLEMAFNLGTGRPKKNLVSSKLPEAEKDKIKNIVRQMLDIVLDEDFFDVGNLSEPMIRVTGPIDIGPAYHGTESEIEKRELLEELKEAAEYYEYMKNLISAFSDYLIFPLSIRNSSTISDESITVTLELKTEGAAFIDPVTVCDNINIPNQIKGKMYKDQILKSIFMMSEADISYDTDISYTDYDREARKFVAEFGSTPGVGYGKEHFNHDIRKYFADPYDAGRKVAYDIGYLKPNETKWLGGALLLKKTDTLEISYRITSDKSDGNISGVLY